MKIKKYVQSSRLLILIMADLFKLNCIYYLTTYVHIYVNIQQCNTSKHIYNNPKNYNKEYKIIVTKVLNNKNNQ